MTSIHIPFTLRSIRSFAHTHDDLPAFHAAFLVLTFLAAALLNLGFFALLIAIHMALDVFKYREVHNLPFKQVVEGVIRESIVDITLLLFGLTIAVYLHPSVTGISGVKGIMLAQLTVVRGAGVIAPKLKILYDFLKVLSHVELYLKRLHPRFKKKPTTLELACCASILLTVALLALAPYMLGFTSAEYGHVLIEELLPWNL